MLKVAMVGCGTMGRSHAYNLSRMPEVEFVGIYDAQHELAEKVAAEYGAAAFASFDEMIGTADPDLVCVTLPTYLHKEYVLRTAEYGKHVFCEKPIAPTVEDAAEMMQFCESKGVKLFVGHVVRFFPEYADMKKHIDSGAIGRIGVVHTKRIGSHPGQARAWYKNASLSGGVIMDLMIHDIDYLRSVLGKAVSVYAVQKTSESLDYALVTLRFANGAIANLEASWGYPGPFTTAAEFAGSEGVIRFNSEQAKSLKIAKTVIDEQGEHAVSVPKSPTMFDPYYLELKHFIECIQTGAEPIVSAADACAALAISLAAAESARTGKPVALQPAEGGL
ncbi:Gfo/Idh/MocA family protein [Paenibacillus thalictri]|uniref:Gfo/Idh/MocA family oxidoreductase n=1 Tax=Paenibacillus thalictri TaxID=2527873 RepID=A0A4Q9DT97_9BACL|nr:Gfo/Idh/MocA family oxidoreductase [Paenibacillus thalictri]TBL78582.1 Gfo/Idh/MocA family oxidoreductase [Paenibacillus thalictri]